MAKRILLLALVLLMLIPSIAACTTAETPDTETDTESEIVENTNDSKETESNKYEVYDNLGDLDYGGKEITIASVDRTWYANEVVVQRVTGDVVNDAIYKRNAAVSKRLNISIKNLKYTHATPQYAVVADLERNAIAGTVPYQIVHAPVYTTSAYITKNLFHNLLATENLDLSQTYWSKYFNDTASIGNGQYVATGAISLTFYRFIFVTLVNDRLLAEDPNAPDLMKVVNDGKWTIEYQTQLANKYYVNNGDASKDEQDIFGHVTSDYLNVDPYWSSCEIRVLEKGDDGYYTYNIDVDRLSSVVDQVLTMFNGNGTFCYRVDAKHETGNGEQIEIAEKFAAGEAVMATIRLNEIEDPSIRDMTDTYTILPIPRYNEDQDDYYSYIHDSFTGVAIPNTVSSTDLPMIGAVLEAMASESYRTVTPAYYEIALKTRHTQNEAGWKMLDRITQNVKMDAVVIFTQALEVDNNTIIKRFRSIISSSYRNSKAPQVSSTYNADLAAKMDNVLNGENGLQTFIRNIQNANS